MAMQLRPITFSIIHWHGFHLLEEDLMFRMYQFVLYRADGDFHKASCTIEVQLHNGVKSPYSQTCQLVERKSMHGDSRAFDPSLFKSMPHSAKWKWKTPFYPRLSTCDNVMVQNAWKGPCIDDFANRHSQEDQSILDTVTIWLSVCPFKCAISIKCAFFGRPKFS